MLIMVSGPDQFDFAVCYELNVLDGDNVIVSPDSSQDILIN